MGEGAKPEDETVPGLGSVDELTKVWDTFREGRAVVCRRDGFPLALAVDAAAGAYRFVCTQCGNSSPWFESGTNGMRIRTAVAAFAAGSTMSDE
jgi:hypothetical protein